MKRKNINSNCLRYDTNNVQNIAGPNVSSNITSIDTQKIGNPSAVVKMKIPSNVVFIYGDATALKGGRAIHIKREYDWK